LIMPLFAGLHVPPRSLVSDYQGTRTRTTPTVADQRLYAGDAERSVVADAIAMA
jgi:hypothetical protein